MVLSLLAQKQRQTNKTASKKLSSPKFKSLPSLFNKLFSTTRMRELRPTLGSFLEVDFKKFFYLGRGVLIHTRGLQTNGNETNYKALLLSPATISVEQQNQKKSQTTVIVELPWKPVTRNSTICEKIFESMSLTRRNMRQFAEAETQFAEFGKLSLPCPVCRKKIDTLRYICRNELARSC